MQVIAFQSRSIGFIRHLLSSLPSWDKAETRTYDPFNCFSLRCSLTVTLAFSSGGHA